MLMGYHRGRQYRAAIEGEVSALPQRWEVYSGAMQCVCVRERERELKLGLSKTQPWSGEELDRRWGGSCPLVGSQIAGHM